MRQLDREDGANYMLRVRSRQKGEQTLGARG